MQINETNKYVNKTRNYKPDLNEKKKNNQNIFKRLTKGLQNFMKSKKVKKTKVHNSGRLRSMTGSLNSKDSESEFSLDQNAFFDEAFNENSLKFGLKTRKKQGSIEVQNICNFNNSRILGFMKLIELVSI